MENNQENKNKNGSKFNAYWIYGVVALFLIGLQFMPMASNTSEPINFEKFAKMAQKSSFFWLSTKIAYIRPKGFSQKTLFFKNQS